jgi:DGQHR domain-containing protein
MSDKSVVGFLLQQQPPVYVAAMPGRWLLDRSTPYWRIKDPIKGFQRYVDRERAHKIAVAVLDQQRTFPNALVVATDVAHFAVKDGRVLLPTKIKFFVVDGQHRLWAQKFSTFDTTICCLVHTGLDEPKMANLFLEINDNQKRVPSSLRWDLVRLVRPEDEPETLAAAELVYQLATHKESPLLQLIDLTGEVKHIGLKQGSLAPEVKSLASRSGRFREIDSDSQLQVLMRYFTAVKALDPKGWRQGSSPFYKARVLRALVKLLRDILKREKAAPPEITSRDYFRYVKRIRAAELESDRIRAIQGNAGIRALYLVMKKQVLGRDQ